MRLWNTNLGVGDAHGRIPLGDDGAGDGESIGLVVCLARQQLKVGLRRKAHDALCTELLQTWASVGLSSCRLLGNE